MAIADSRQRGIVTQDSRGIPRCCGEQSLDGASDSLDGAGLCARRFSANMGKAGSV